MAKNLWLKSCPKCRGDLTLEQDRWGRYRVCIQCGYSDDLRTETHHAQRGTESAPAMAAGRKAA